MSPQINALYRFYDVVGQLLYVGVTADPGTRWKAHSKDKPWWIDVTRVTVEHHPSREAVLEAERSAIVAEKPLHNIVHNAGRAIPDGHLHWPNEADQMPDDCHDVCVKTGLSSVYYPYRWSGGVAHYRCTRGHSWTCGWGLVKGSGEALENFGHAVSQVIIGRLAVGV